MKQASAFTILTLFLSAALILIGLVMAWSWNGLIGKEEAVISAWSQVESNYQRRADLVPNLVKTVQSFAAHERETLTTTTEARGQNLETAVAGLAKAQGKAATLTQGGKEKLSDEAYMKQLAQSQGALGTQMRSVFALAENYPILRSSEAFLELQAQLEGTENRINVARMNFNEEAKDFNSAIRRFPGAVLAGMGDFKRKAYFEADEGAEKTVKVNFGSGQGQ